MNSDQIEKALRENPETRQLFRGVYARDVLPANPCIGFYVVNFDKTGELGSHWLCVEVRK